MEKYLYDADIRFLRREFLDSIHNEGCGECGECACRTGAMDFEQLKELLITYEKKLLAELENKRLK
jgi:hypothetical protein